MILRFGRDKKASNSAKNVEKLKNIIEYSIKNNRLNIEFINDLAAIVDLPKEIIQKKIKQLVSKDFDFKKFTFKSNNFLIKKFYSNFIFLLKFTFLLLLIKIFNFKNTKFYTSVLIENIESNQTLNIYKKMILKKREIFVLKKGFFLLKDEIVSSKNELLIPFKADLYKNKKIYRLVFKYFLLSIKYKCNFLDLLFGVIYSYAKNQSKYSYIKSNYLLHNRIYLSCPIRNYLYKELGGKRTITIQSHIIENTISLFSDIDLLLSFGKSSETQRKLIKLGGKLNKVKPIGSLRMEYELGQKKKFKQINKIDILILGVNPTIWMDASENIKKNYYIFLDWMIKISKMYPNLNIVYKHHETFKGDSKEDKMISKSNIKRIIFGKKKLSSYHYLIRSSLSLSYCSTMVLEAQGINKYSFFVDPNNAGTTFFSNLPSLKKLRINKFGILVKYIDNFFYNKNFNFKMKNNDLICLKNKRVTENILKILK